MTLQFSAWLSTTISQKGISASEFARRAGVTRGAISSLINGRRRPGRDMLNGISMALNLPIDEIYQVAGYSDSPGDDLLSARIAHMASLLPDTDKADVLDFIEYKLYKQDMGRDQRR